MWKFPNVFSDCQKQIVTRNMSIVLVSGCIAVIIQYKYCKKRLFENMLGTM